jgi:hypothetical protein
MNYAALLALLSALSFTLPFLVRMAERLGIPRSYSSVVTLAGALFVALWAYLRWRQRADQYNRKMRESQNEYLPDEPYVPDIFFEDGVFKGTILLAQGYTQEALQLYQTYRDILQRQGHATDELDEMIVRLSASKPVGSGVRTPPIRTEEEHASL